MRNRAGRAEGEMDDSTAPPLGRVDIYAGDLLESPWAYFERLRDEAPVLRHEPSGIYQVSSMALVIEAAADSETYSNVISHALHGKAAVTERVRAVMAEGYERVQTLHTADPPIHTRSRKLVNKAFTMKRVNAMAEDIAAVADRLIDAFVARGSCEFLGEFAQPLPLLIILRQLGVPDEDLDLALGFNEAFAAQYSQVSSEEEEVAAARRIVEFQHYFAAMVAEKRRCPGDDIISTLANATLDEEGDHTPLTVPEILQIIQQLLVAGNETTASTLAEGMVFLITHPETMAQVRSDPEARTLAVEEIIRLHTPVQSMWRVVTRDTLLGGVEIEKGALVLLRFGSANRDRALFDAGDRFRIGRPDLKRHVAFGYGIHFCIGAALARREMSIAFERLLARLGGLRLAPSNDLRHRTSLLLRGLKRLDLEFDRPA